MSDKMECPGCGSYSSTILGAFERGERCPTCGLHPSATIRLCEELDPESGRWEGFYSIISEEK